MKRVYAILNWTFGILFFLTGIGSLMSGRFAVSLIFIAISLIFLPMIVFWGRWFSKRIPHFSAVSSTFAIARLTLDVFTPR